MYIEKNGYVIMETEQMSFISNEMSLADDVELTDNIEDAEVYDEYNIAKEYCDGLNEENKITNDSLNKYEVVKYQKTIWLDKSGLNNEITTLDCEGNHCGCCHANIISDDKVQDDFSF